MGRMIEKPPPPQHAARRFLAPFWGFRGGPKTRRTAAARAYDLVDVKRVDDHPRTQHVLDRERLVVEGREWILERISALIDRYLRHLLGLGAVLIHMAMRDHRVAAVRTDIAVRSLEFALHRDDWHALVAELVQVCDDTEHGVAHPSVDRGRGSPYHPDRTGPADIDLVEHARVDPQHFASAGRVQHPRIRN